MISLAKFKILLGKEAQNYTDEQIEQIMAAQYQLADLAFQSWIKQKEAKKIKQLLIIDVWDTSCEVATTCQCAII